MTRSPARDDDSIWILAIGVLVIIAFVIGFGMGARADNACKSSTITESTP